MESAVLESRPATSPHRGAGFDGLPTPLRVDIQGSDLGVSASIFDCPTSDALEPDCFLGKFRILRQIGRGGMARVRARFEREAQTLASLTHPNIVAIHDFFDDGRHSVTVMEQVNGQTLRERLRTGALGLEEALRYGSQVAEALASAHDLNVIHRDIKPENILISATGQAKLADFGLSKRPSPIAPSGNDTDAGMVLGTAAYMSPEQVRGEDLDFRSDLFAFGIVLFEMVAGEHPFPGETAADTVVAILRNPPLVASRDPGLEAVLDIARRCLGKRREDRYGTTHELARILSIQRRRLIPSWFSPFSPASFLVLMESNLSLDETAATALRAGILRWTSSASRRGPE
jgi:serine/threonine protein kinase